ncbi:DUF3987 domain-containing protein [Pseudomonas asiatica]|uniref:YfjI family protein n=1 Tax=Pseudomonas asiatica TaxID=2219225 RepID=UPI002367927E|nr:YfjI family protein [Pseudomonas asiatica]WDM86048.1 DUF3987 domain-containing protein [Pseudomonas asiatica]
MMHSEKSARQPSWGRGGFKPKEASNKHNVLDPIPNLPFEIFTEAVDEVQRNIKSPRELAVCSALAMMSLAAQGLYDVKSPLGNVFPLSLAIMAISGSGDGKTPTFRALSSRVYKYQEVILLERNLELGRYKAAHGIWLETLKAHKSTLRKFVRRGEDAEEIARLICEHQEKEPKPPLNLLFINDDVTVQALFQSMSGGLSSAGWMSSEASGILKGGAFQHIDKVNSVWSGDGVRAGRVSSDSYWVSDARLALCLMVQPSVFESFCELKGDVARGTGLIARFLFCRPRSTQGSRIDDGGEQGWQACERFGDRAVALLKEYVDNCRVGRGVRKVIRLSERASMLWVDVRNQIEREISEDGVYGWAPDHASKLAENMLRLAAVFHVFEGRDGDVSETTMRASVELGYWFSRQFDKVFSPDTMLENDASELHAWIRSYYDKNGEKRIDKTYIRRYAPNRLRDSDRLEMLYEKLAGDGLIRLVLEGKKGVVILR